MKFGELKTIISGDITRLNKCRSNIKTKKEEIDTAYEGKAESYSSVITDIISNLEAKNNGCDDNIRIFLLAMCYYKMLVIDCHSDMDKSNLGIIKNDLISILCDSEKLIDAGNTLYSLIYDFSTMFFEHGCRKDLNKIFLNVSLMIDKAKESSTDDCFNFDCYANNIMDSQDKDLYNRVIKHISLWKKYYDEYKYEIAAYYLHWFNTNWPDITTIAFRKDKEPFTVEDIIKENNEIMDSLSPEFINQNTKFEIDSISDVLEIKNNRFVNRNNYSQDNQLMDLYSGSLSNLLPFHFSITTNLTDYYNRHLIKCQKLLDKIDKIANQYYEDDYNALKEMNTVVDKYSKELSIYKDKSKLNEAIIEKFKALCNINGICKETKKDFETALRMYKIDGIGLDIVLLPICGSVERELNKKIFDIIKEILSRDKYKETRDKVYDYGDNFVKQLWFDDEKSNVTLGYKFYKINKTNDYYKPIYEIFEGAGSLEFLTKTLKSIRRDLPQKEKNVHLKLVSIRNAICHRNDSEIKEIVKDPEMLMESLLEYLGSTEGFIRKIIDTSDKIKEKYNLSDEKEKCQ